MECLDTATLCRYLDQELDGGASHVAATHLHACAHCAQQLQMLQEGDAMLRLAWPGPQSPDTPEPVCYSAEEITTYIHGLLSPPEEARFEQHLCTCDFCLRQVMGLHGMRPLLHGETLLTPPAHLLAPAPRAYTRLGALIVQVAQSGLQFLEALALPEDVRLTVGGRLLPAGALRGSAQEEGGAAALLEIEQTAGELELGVKILHEEHEAVLLTIQVRKHGRPLGHQRVELLRAGRMLYSAPTSAGGETEALRLVPGEYTVRLPEEHVETQYVLRFARGTGGAG